MASPSVERIVVAKVARRAIPDMMGHLRQVTFLALALYDALMEALSLHRGDRLLLEHAAMLHDIGWVGGQKSHHKQSKKMIIEDTLLPFSPRRRMLIALIARYHRRSQPLPTHSDYAALGDEERARVLRLSALLRVADELDILHEDLVQSVTCELQQKYLVLHCQVKREWMTYSQRPLKKSGLLEELLGKKISLECCETSRLLRVD